MRKKMAIVMVLALMVVAFAGIPMNVGAEEDEAATPQLLGASPVIGLGSGLSLEATLQGSSSDPLSEILPSWVDIVDAEVVSNDGDGVYIAVLDTGLLEGWPYFFSEANIAWELGKGFSHDVWWDGTIGDFVFGPLLDNRGFVTNEYGSGHGTFVTSLITGYRLGDYWVRGVAPKATIIPVLVLDSWFLDCPDPNYQTNMFQEGVYDGKVDMLYGSYEMVSAGICYIADLAETLDGPVIITMSLGSPVPNKLLEDAVDYANDKGVSVVASPGNLGDLGMIWPAAYPQVISVGAAGWTENWVPLVNFNFWMNDVPEKLNTKDVWGNNWQICLTDYSSRPNKDLGQKPSDLDFTTIGSWSFGPHKLDIFWNGVEWVNPTPAYIHAGGTSMSTPIAAAIAALVLQDHPGVDPREMEKILKNAASGLPLACDGARVFEFSWSDGVFNYRNFKWRGTDYGAGFLQADAALKAAKTHA